MQLKIKSDGTAHGTRVTDEHGRPIKGITGLSFHVSIPDQEIAKVWLRFHARVELDARLEEGMYVIEQPDGEGPGVDVRQRCACGELDSPNHRAVCWQAER